MKPLPTLSVHGIVRSPKMAMSVLLSDALTTYQSQCWVWKDYAVSIPYYVQIYGNRPDTLVEQLQSVLQAYFLRYFQTVVVNCQHNCTSDNPRYRLSLSVHAVIDGVTYDIGDSFGIENSAINRTMSAFNGE